MATKRYKTVTIAEGESTTGLIDLQDESLVGLIVPAAWTTAAITFQDSVDGATGKDMYSNDGTTAAEVTVPEAAVVADHSIKFIGNLLHAFATAARWINIRSGTTATPVTQETARSIVLVLRNIG